jgi:multimeric flavodoxin WrbA/protein-tyrosine-phosphatase
MLVLGLQGSPRKNGNTDILLESFMTAARDLGAATETIYVSKRDIQPCEEYIVCEKRGFCPIKDEMNTIYALLRRAEVVVAASPVFFYGITAQLKALMDRCQTLWARKYKLGLRDPHSERRKGLLLAVAATKGKHLFEGMELTAKYFFDGISAAYDGCIGYREVEARGEMTGHPTYLKDMSTAAARLVGSLAKRRRLLIVSQSDACRGQMAGAFARALAGDRLDVLTAGTHPATGIGKAMPAAMAEKGIDLGFHAPRDLEAVLAEGTPDWVVTIGPPTPTLRVETARVTHWDLPNPAEESMTQVRNLRDEIERQVAELTARH